MGNPQIPVKASDPIVPPFFNLPFGQVRGDGSVYLTPAALQFLQVLWASIAGAGGIMDILATVAGPGVAVGQIEARAPELAREEMLKDAPPNGLDAIALLRGSILLPPSILPSRTSGPPVQTPPNPTLDPPLRQHPPIYPSPTTFTPTLKGATTPGANTYSVQAGTYFEIGNLSLFSISVALSALDVAMAGLVTIEGLPIPPVNVGALFPAVWGNVTLPAGDSGLAASCPLGGSTSLLLLGYGSGVGATPLTAANLSATSSVTVNGAYFH